jgi:hypothetical protein
MENRPGRLQKILSLLNENEINITTLTIAETTDFGVLRMIVNKTDLAMKILKENNITAAPTQVLAIEIPDQPGALARAVGIISERGLNIEYMYAYAHNRGDQAVMIFSFDDTEAAREALAGGGFRIVRKSDITGE